MKRWRAALALLLALLLFASACGDDDDGGGGGGEATPSTEDEGSAELEPQSGGTLRFGLWQETKTLDPIGTAGIGTSGGIELNAIYDLLVAWDPETNEYEPRIAESLTSNDDYTQWTLKLRSGVTFTDGTTLDAEAVRFNFDRQKANTNARGLLAGIKEMRVVDPLTIQFDLTEPWAGFPIVFNNSTGNIVSPTAVAKLGDQGIATNPVGAGAGPFIVEAFRPGEGLFLTKNPNYWGGEVYLDRIEFKFVGGGPTTYESLIADALDAAFLRDVSTIARAESDGIEGDLTPISAGEMLIFNHGISVVCKDGEPAWGCAGQPDGTSVATQPTTASLKVRQAIQAALDLEVINERVNDGKGRPSVSLLDESFPWNPGVEMPETGTDRAKRLVDEAKAEGWNGVVSLNCGAESPERRNLVIAVEALLGQAGISLDKSKASITVAEQTTNVIVNKNFEMSCWGLQLSPDDDSTRQIEQFLRSGSGSNRSGYANPKMDAALSDLKTSSSDDERTSAWKSISEIWNEDMIGVPLFATPQGTFWNADVHGIRTTGLSSVLLDKAWIEG